MRKYIKAIVAYAIILVIGLLPSCYVDYICPPPILYYFDGVRVQAIDWEETNGSSTTSYADTLRTNIGFEITTKVKIASVEQKQNQPFNFGFINSAYANNCNGDLVLNQIVSENNSLTVNKSFEVNGIVAEAGTNLLNNPNIKAWLDFPATLSYENRLNVKFDKRGLDIENGEYEFTFHWETNDELILEDKVTVYIDL